MCILFLYTPSENEGSDYKFILATNRDELYKRPTKNMAPWDEDPTVIGGRDLFSPDKGTWLAVSTLHKKIGVLLNLPGGDKIANAKSRGRIVADYVKSKESAIEYAEKIRQEGHMYNEFLLVAIEFGNSKPSVQTFSNASNCILSTSNPCQGFGNSLPDTPLKKVEVGKRNMEDICKRLNKVEMKEQLVSELVCLLKSEEKHLPDPELERRCPNMSHLFSSIYLNLGEKLYGSRTHTIITVTKSGHLEMIEITLQTPVNLENPVWTTTEYQFDV